MNMRTGKHGGLVFDVPTPYYPSDALSLDELAHWVAFSRFPGIGPKRFHKLLSIFDDNVTAAWQAEGIALAEAGIDQRTIEKFVAHRKVVTPQQELERLEKRRIRVITLKDETYPPLLRKFEYAPIVLYIYGRLTEDDNRFTLGVVGTRKMSSYGRQVTERLTTDLAKGNITIVSGLALGVDTVAHQSALTIVVFYSRYLTHAPARIPYRAGRYRNNRLVSSSLLSFPAAH